MEETKVDLGHMVEDEDDWFKIRQVKDDEDWFKVSTRKIEKPPPPQFITKMRPPGFYLNGREYKVRNTPLPVEDEENCIIF